MATVNAKVNLKQKLQNMEAETKDSSKVDNDKVNKDSIVPSSCTDTKLQASLKGGDINVSNNTAGDDSEEATKTDCQSAANVVSCDHDYFAVSRQGQDVTMDTEEEEDSDVEVMELDSESSGADTPKKNCTQGNYTKDLENIDCKLSDNSADVKESPVFLSPADKEYLTKTEIQLPSQQSQLPSQQSQLPSQQSQLPSQQSQLPSQQSQTLAQNTKIPGADALAVVKASLGNKPMTDIEAIDNKKSSSVALQPTKIVSPRGRGRKKGYSPKKSPKSATSTTVTSATIVQTVNKNQGILTNVKINATNLLQGDVSKSDSCVTTEEPSMSQESIDQKNKIQELKRKYCEVEDVDSDLHANKLYDASDIDDPFYFESDSAALKGNKDYRLLLRTLVTLEGQRIQAVQDLETLFENQQKSICQPIEFVQRLQCKEKMNLPCPQRVVPVPNIAWDKYGVSVTSTGSNSIESSHQLRSKLNKQTVLEEKDNVSVADSVENEGSAKNEDTMVVRGRVGDSSKPATFNQLWTIEEQRRLEELLVKYPPEEVEAKRWAKIAKDLGNRSTKQVASRVQKYFIKLAKAGLPVPGRTPNLQSYINRHRRKQHYFTRPLYPASTLLQSHVPPVYMDDDNDKCYDDLDHYSDEEEPASDDDSVPEHLRDTEEYRELMNMKKLKKEKLKLQQSGQSQHVGYCCDGCHSEPIIGIRWHCVDCPLEVSVDLCHSCAECGHVTDLHTPSHRMECIRYAEASTGYIDGDYTEFQPYAGDYNYLDPNYNPAKLPS
ncbi:ZZ-type zinc finger-containing protein 3-like [Saccoglossus kowalevskii]